jgi:hypothetical protein
MLTQARLHELFELHPDGHLIRRVTLSPRGRARVGDQVRGWLTGDGYRTVRVDGKCYLLHRVIFLYTHGYLPDGLYRTVDHEDRDKSNNRPGNLRDVTKSQNNMNTDRVLSTDPRGVRQRENRRRRAERLRLG